MDPRLLTIVTGAGRGIGRAIALRMSRETAIAAVSRTESELSDLCHGIMCAGGRAWAVAGDVTDPATAARVAEIFDTYEVRNLVLNAGIGMSGLIHEQDDALWESILDVNILGAQRFLKVFLPKMIAQGGGNVILMSSMAGLKGYPHTAAYTASKHALVGLAKAMAKDYGSKGIVTVAICPGFVESDMTTRSIKSLAARRGCSEDEARERIARVNPQRRIIPAEEIAEMAAFVCSGKVPSLSGSALVMGGGE